MFQLNPIHGVIVAAALAISCSAPTSAQDLQSSPAGSQQSPGMDGQSYAFHAQETFVVQGDTAFHSPYEGANSLNPRGQVKETYDLSLFAGLRAWSGAEVWVNPEIDQGFGLSDTLGVAGFPSGEAYKVGRQAPYPKLQRWFLRQTINLGGESEKVDPDLLKLRGKQSANRIVFTVGKFSVVDVFDNNDLAHDPRNDFLNWGMIDAATFDYAANAWGYTYGAAAELYASRVAVRAGIFDLSTVPNSVDLDPAFHQYQLDAEIEEHHSIGGQPGSLALTFFTNHGRMGRFDDAIALAQATGTAPDTGAVRHYRNRSGLSLNLQQQLSKYVSLFARGGFADGQIEPFEFIDADRSFAGGVSIKGIGWKRDDDTVGIAVLDNAISKIHQRYLALGGLGILVGDGQLPHPGHERSLEAYYDVAVSKIFRVTFDGQFITNPAYNRDRGPIPVGAVRLHAQF